MWIFAVLTDVGSAVPLLFRPEDAATIISKQTLYLTHETTGQFSTLPQSILSDFGPTEGSSVSGSSFLFAWWSFNMHLRMQQQAVFKQMCLSPCSEVYYRIVCFYWCAVWGPKEHGHQIFLTLDPCVKGFLLKLLVMWSIGDNEFPRLFVILWWETFWNCWTFCQHSVSQSGETLPTKTLFKPKPVNQIYCEMLHQVFRWSETPLRINDSVSAGGKISLICQLYRTKCCVDSLCQLIPDGQYIVLHWSNFFIQ